MFSAENVFSNLKPKMILNHSDAKEYLLTYLKNQRIFKAQLTIYLFKKQ
jgi:hypothetical protein